MSTKEADEISHLLMANTHDDIFFFTDKGRVFKIPVFELPEGSRQSKGQAIVNLISIETDEKIQSILTLNPQNKKRGQYMLMATKNGVVKKTAIKEFSNIRANGLIAINLRADDQLCRVTSISKRDQAILVTQQGKSIRFKEENIRPTKRDTQGVMGIRLKKEDHVSFMDSFPARLEKPQDRRRKYFRDLFVVFEKGIGKRTPVTEYPLQKRGGVGVKVAQLSAKTGPVVCVRIVTQETKQIILTSKKAQVIKLPLKNIPRLHRASQGVILMRFAKANDCVAAMTCIEGK